jgi:inhibitor of cysteine peptidase
MKKIVAAVLAIMMLGAIGLALSGCSVAEVKAYTEPGQTITAAADQEFTIALGSNPTTGYSWQPVYDEKCLTLTSRDYQADDTTGKQIAGAGGTEYFHFKALKSGETQVKFTYQRPWETPTAQDQTQIFTINVK